MSAAGAPAEEEPAWRRRAEASPPVRTRAWSMQRAAPSLRWGGRKQNGCTQKWSPVLTPWSRACWRCGFHLSMSTFVGCVQTHTSLGERMHTRCEGAFTGLLTLVCNQTQVRVRLWTLDYHLDSTLSLQAHISSVTSNRLRPSLTPHSLPGDITS